MTMVIIGGAAYGNGRITEDIVMMMMMMIMRMLKIMMITPTNIL